MMVWTPDFKALPMVGGMSAVVGVIATCRPLKRSRMTGSNLRHARSARPPIAFGFTITSVLIAK